MGVMGAGTVKLVFRECMPSGLCSSNWQSGLQPLCVVGDTKRLSDICNAAQRLRSNTVNPPGRVWPEVFEGCGRQHCGGRRADGKVARNHTLLAGFINLG